MIRFILLDCSTYSIWSRTSWLPGKAIGVFPVNSSDIFYTNLLVPSWHPYSTHLPLSLDHLAALLTVIRVSMYAASGFTWDPFASNSPVHVYSEHWLDFRFEALDLNFPISPCNWHTIDARSFRPPASMGMRETRNGAARVLQGGRILRAGISVCVPTLFSFPQYLILRTLIPPFLLSLPWNRVLPWLFSSDWQDHEISCSVYIFEKQTEEEGQQIEGAGKT